MKIVKLNPDALFQFTFKNGLTAVLKVKIHINSKACVNKPKNGFQDQVLLNVGKKYCRMLPPWSILKYFDLH